MGAQHRENRSTEDVGRLLDILRRDDSALGKRDYAFILARAAA